MRIRRVVILLTAMLAGTAPAGAQAANWISPAATLSAATGAPIEQPVIASNARGDTAVAWKDPATGRVFASERPVGGAFTVGAQVSAQGDTMFGNVQIDDAGTIYVFYISDQSNPAASVPNVATKAIGAATWTVTTLTPANSQDPAQSLCRGVISPDGKGLVVWFQGHTNGAQFSLMQFARKAAGSSTWSAKATVSSAAVAMGNTHSQALAMNAAGQAALLWGRAGSAHLFGATMTAAGVWNTPNQITSGGTAQTFPWVLAVDAAGTATAAWARGDTPSTTTIQFSSKTNAAASWPTVTLGGANDLSASTTAGSPAIALAPDATTTVGWVQGTGVVERTRPAVGGAFAAATTIPGSITAVNGLQLGAAPDGSVAAVWSGLNTDMVPKTVLAAARRASGALTFSGLPTAPGTGNASPALAVDDQGNAPTVWLHNDSGQITVQATGLDLAPPAASAVTFPATGAAGTAFPYGATLTDRWSAAAGLWAFGDGTTGALNGSKSYANGGSFTATLTATDGAGNTSTTDRAITVSGPTGGGGGGGTGDTTAPVLSALSLTPTTFAVNTTGRAEALVAARAKRGTTIRYRLSEDATVRLLVERATLGRRSGSRCVKRTRANRSRKTCTRFVKIGAFRHAGKAGANAHTFSGRIGKSSLRVARHRISLVATDAAGNRSATRRATFRVVRR